MSPGARIRVLSWLSPSAFFSGFSASPPWDKPNQIALPPRPLRASAAMAVRAGGPLTTPVTVIYVLAIYG